MVGFKTGDVDIQFPFVPYEIQKDLMAKVVECIQNKQNGLLESPTGTGKTLSLLCAAVAWQKKHIEGTRESKILAATKTAGVRGAWGSNNNNNNNLMDTTTPADLFHVPKIIYASRTHAQLSQAARELKKSFYSTTKSVVLGSRDVMCIHDGVSRLPTSSAKIIGCHVQVKSRTCHYYNNVSTRKEEISTVVMDKPVMDIEDLVTTGRRNRLCPFFMSRELVKDAHVIFMPYNYLMDPKLRAMHGVDLKNCVIILDEGHNIAKMCEESVSFEIKNSTVTKCIQEVTTAMNEFSQITQQIGVTHTMAMSDMNMGTLVALKQSFLQLETGLDSLKISNASGQFISAEEILTAIYQNGFPPAVLAKTISDLDAISSFHAMSHRDASGCDTFSSMLRILSSQAVFLYPHSFADSFKIYVTEEKRPTNKVNSVVSVGRHVPKVFNIWCFNPAIGLEMMLQFAPRCILLASGTLSPLGFLENELRAPFPVKLSNPHIIGDNQLFATIVKAGPAPKCVTLSSSYSNRGNHEYLAALGEIVFNTCSIVPKGVLVFFQSYVVMELCTNFWKSSGLLDRIGRYKAVYIEPRGKTEFNQVMSNYYQSVKDTNGACLMAVCRGKVSEGIDFADDNGRAVIITGIPYAPVQDPQVQAKRNYLDSKGRANNGINGSTWYQLEAVRALNQAMGRIIRHARDFGAVLLCDQRFDGSDVLNHLSPWIAKRLKKTPNFSQTMTELAGFFKKPVLPKMNYATTYESGSGGAFQTSASNQRSTKPLGFSGISSSKGVSQDKEVDTDMDCDISSMYSQYHSTSSSTKTTSSADLFSSLETVKTRAALDFVSSSNSKSSALTNNNPTSSTSQALKRSGDKDIKFPQKRIKMQMQSFLPYQSAPIESLSALNLRPSSSGSACSNGDMDIDMDPLSPAQSPRQEFHSAKEFSLWAKADLSQQNYSRFVEAMKIFKNDRDEQKLGEELRKIFAGEKFQKCLHGMKFVMTESAFLSLVQRFQILFLCEKEV